MPELHPSAVPVEARRLLVLVLQDVELVEVQPLILNFEEFRLPLQQVVLSHALFQFTTVRLVMHRLLLHLDLNLFEFLLLTVEAGIQVVYFW